MAKLQYPAIIETDKKFTALADLGKRLNSLDKAQIMTSFVDLVPAEFLPLASKQAQKHANQAEKLFKYGEKNLDNVLTAQLTALDTQRQIVDAQLKQAQNLVGLYKALGGGWQK